MNHAMRSGGWKETGTPLPPRTRSPSRLAVPAPSGARPGQQMGSWCQPSTWSTASQSCSARRSSGSRTSRRTRQPQCDCGRGRAAAETFVDCDSRRMFHNAVEFATLSRRGCAALSLLRAAPRRRPEGRGGWRRLAPRAGITVATGPLQGWLDTAEAGLVRGWARDAANSDMPGPVEVVVDGVVLGSTLANRYRADLATAGYGHGQHGFEFRFPAPLASDRPHMLVARRATDRAPLTGAATVAERRSPSPRCSLRSAHRATRKE